MSRGKYIIFSSIESGEFPILFPSHIDHCFIAEMFRNGCKAVSAGRFEVCAEPSENDDNDISVWAGDKSVTLKIGSREQDAKIIKKILRHKYTF